MTISDNDLMELKMMLAKVASDSLKKGETEAQYFNRLRSIKEELERRIGR